MSSVVGPFCTVYNNQLKCLFVRLIHLWSSETEDKFFWRLSDDFRASIRRTLWSLSEFSMPKLIIWGDRKVYGKPNSCRNRSHRQQRLYNSGVSTALFPMSEFRLKKRYPFDFTVLGSDQLHFHWSPLFWITRRLSIILVHICGLKPRLDPSSLLLAPGLRAHSYFWLLNADMNSNRNSVRGYRHNQSKLK